MHELANPVQAAQTALRLWHSETPSAADPNSRLHGLDRAFEHIATVLHCVQAAKDSSLLPPAAVTSDKLLADLTAECSVFGVETVIEEWPADPVTLRLHGAAIPFLLAGWAGVARSENRKLKMSLIAGADGWKLNALLRDGDGDAVRKDSHATAGFPAAIGEFMAAAAGHVEVHEDNQSVFEIAIFILEYSGDEQIRMIEGL